MAVAARRARREQAAPTDSFSNLPQGWSGAHRTPAKGTVARFLEEGLREACYQQLVRISATTGLVAAIETHDPDVLVIDLEDPSRDALADIFLISRHVRRPITMLVDQSDSASIEAAVEAGVSAYIVDGLKKERMQPILQTCISRFNTFRKLRRELDDARSQLADRKTIDRAKSIVMRLKGLFHQRQEQARRAMMNPISAKGAIPQTIGILEAEISLAVIPAFGRGHSSRNKESRCKSGRRRN